MVPLTAKDISLIDKNNIVLATVLFVPQMANIVNPPSDPTKPEKNPVASIVSENIIEKETRREIPLPMPAAKNPKQDLMDITAPATVLVSLPAADYKRVAQSKDVQWQTKTINSLSDMDSQMKTNLLESLKPTDVKRVILPVTPPTTPIISETKTDTTNTPAVKPSSTVIKPILRKKRRTVR
jgi:hypothetical protein